MYAKVRKASSRRGEPTSARSAGLSSSTAATRLPIGSSTSGTQISSGLDKGSKRIELLVASPPGELAGDGEEERGEEPAQRVLRQGLGEEAAPGDAADRDEPEDERRPPADIPVAALAPGSGEDRREDREQRGRLGVTLVEAEREERRHEEEPASDAEQPRDDAGGE